MEKVIQQIKNFFEENDWKYTFNEEKNIFSTELNMNNVLGILRMYIFLRETSYVVSTVLNSSVEEQYYGQISEYLHRANFGMRNGNFEFDYNDGEVRFKTFVNFEDMELSDAVIADSIFVSAAMVDQYGKKLIQLMVSDAETPSDLIEEIESSDSEF